MRTSGHGSKMAGVPGTVELLVTSVERPYCLQQIEACWFDWTDRRLVAPSAPVEAQPVVVDDSQTDP